MLKDLTNKVYRKEIYAVVFASFVVAFYTVLMAVVLYFTYCKMESDNIEHYRQQMVKEADSLAYFLKERQEEVVQYSQNPFILAYFKNKALEMSYSLGLSQNLLAIKNEFSSIIDNKKYIDGTSIYKALALFDIYGEQVTEVNPKKYNFYSIKRTISSSGELASIYIGTNSKVIFITSPCKIRGKTVGWLAGIIEWNDIFDRFLQVTSTKNNSHINMDEILVAILDNGKFLIKTGSLGFSPDFFEDIYLDFLEKEGTTNTYEFYFKDRPYISYLAPIKFTAFYYQKIYPKCQVTHIYKSKILLNGLIIFGFLLSFWLFVSLKKSIESIFLKAEVKRAEELAKSKSDFLATMSHEIRTPLNGLIGALYLMKDEAISKQVKAYLDTAIRLGDRLIDIVNNILQYSRLEDGEKIVVRKEFNPQALVEDLIELSLGLLRDKDVNIYSYVDCPQKVVGDEGKIGQILVNLIGNSIKFTQRGWIKVSAKCEQRADDCLIVFEVEDTGCGIPKDMTKKIFKAFEQGEHSIQTLLGGSGLGLTIVKRLTDLLNGKLELKTKEGHGTRFRITLPLELPETVSTEARRLDGDHYGYLIAIKDKILKEIVTGYLKKWGIKAKELSKGIKSNRKMVLIADEGAMQSDKALNIIKGFPEQQIAVIEILKQHSSLETYRPSDFVTHLLKSPIKAQELYDALRAPFNHLFKKEEITGFEEKVAFDLKCLLVEDNILNQKITRAMLEKMGVKVDVASNGQEAIKKYRKNHYDFILMDCQMPVLDGFEATKRIREIEKDEGRPGIQIIALTAHVLDDTQTECFIAGMNDYLAKPVTPKDLKKLIKGLQNSK